MYHYVNQFTLKKYKFFYMQNNKFIFFYSKINLIIGNKSIHLLRNVIFPKNNSFRLCCTWMK